MPLNFHNNRKKIHVNDFHCFCIHRVINKADRKQNNEKEIKKPVSFINIKNCSPCSRYTEKNSPAPNTFRLGS